MFKRKKLKELSQNIQKVDFKTFIYIYIKNIDF